MVEVRQDRFYNDLMIDKSKPTDTADQMMFDGPDRLLLDSLILTHDAVVNAFQDLLRGYDISYTQYCVLSVLDEVRDEGMRTQRLGARLLTRVPDITRLVDRLVKAGLVERRRSAEDKRVVFVAITDAGVELLSEIKAPAKELQSGMFTNLSGDKQTLLNQLLHELRDGAK